MVQPPFLIRAIREIRGLILLVPGRDALPKAPLLAGLTTLPNREADNAYLLWCRKHPDRKKALLPNEAKLFTPKTSCNKLSINNL
jgi:hypothetical protein